MVSTLRLGSSARGAVSWSFEKLETRWRLCLLNSDESGSMQGQLHHNALAFDRVAAASGDRFDAVIAHGFGSDSEYHVYAVAALVPLLRAAVEQGGLAGAVTGVASAEDAVRAARAFLAARTTHGSTCPQSHPRFLERLADALDAHPGALDLTVVNTSDGGFDGGAPQREIQERMARITARCRCRLVANVLVGSAGSPAALHFFTGDPEAFDSRLLFTTTAVAADGVLRLDAFDPRSLAPGDEEPGEERFTLQPSTAFWTFNKELEELVAFWPEGAAPVTELTLRRHQPQPGGREVVLASPVRLAPAPVTIDEDAREVFGVIARSLSDNPYVRDDSRRALNGLVAQLERLLATRADVLRALTAPPDDRARIAALERELADNLRAIQAARDADLSLRARSARINALNNARRLLKDTLRETHEALDQQLLERELAFVKEHPGHWVTWLQPALDALRAQLARTQQEVGSAMQHLSTRIRTKKSRDDGQARAADRYVEALVARSRERHDRAGRRADPGDAAPFERPGRWLTARCPISGAAVTEGVAGLPFVADRSDLTSGNVAAGGQNVDRLPVAADALLSLGAVRGLMWGANGQMASPFCTGRGVYNAVIPVLLGPATPASVRDLEKAIGWLCTGTPAFEPAMAEAVPGALGAVLGRLDAPAAREGGALTPDEQAHALLRTTALFERFRSYPYVPNTSVLDEAAAKLPLPEVWAQSVEAAAASACLQNAGCVTSLLARAVGARRCDVPSVARGMFAWACRNVARAVLGAASGDGRGGVEGVRRLAALLRLDVELAGYPPVAPAPGAPGGVAPGGVAPDGVAPGAGRPLDPATLESVLGDDLARWWDLARPVGRDEFVEVLNDWLSALPPDRAMTVVERLGDVLARFDRLAPPPTMPAGAPPAVRVTPATHAHFDLLALEALSPVRAWTETPGLADENLALRRVLKAGAVTWVAPRDARLPAGRYNPSALRFLNEHSALQPLRALLRLDAAGCVGLDALEALRARDEAPPFPRVDDAVGALAGMVGGMDEVMLLAHRAFAFVVAEAHGYADKRWAESRLRTASLAECEAVLGLEPAASAAPEPVHYGRAPLVIQPAAGPTWPRMLGRGYLPKRRLEGPRGEPLGEPYRCTQEEARLPDADLCHSACAALLTRLEGEREGFVHGLHRQARAALGAYPVDLRTLSVAEQDRVLAEELVPRLAGRVRGDVHHPAFFQKCAGILKAMVALGEDTRTFRAEEPEALLHEEAEAIRAASR